MIKLNLLAGIIKKTSLFFKRKRVVDMILGELVGKLVGFIVGMRTTKLFAHEVYEKKKLKHIFGLAKRKKHIINDTPEWLQWSISIFVGFIVLELISYFFEHKLYLRIWEYFRIHLNKEKRPVRPQ